MDDHDELICPGLHEIAFYTVKAFGISKGSLDLEKWFKTVFTEQNPQIAGGFEISRDEFEGKEVIELVQYDEDFSMNSLIMMFDQYRFQLEQNRPKLEIMSTLN